MFPDVRLIVAATLASVLALICGFAMFAALGVSHQPVVALSPASAPLRPLADTIAAPLMTFAAAERRLPPREPQRRPGETAASPTRLFEDRRGAEPVPAVAAAPTHHAIEAAETTAGATPKDAAAAPVVSPADRPAIRAAVANTPTAHDEAPAASPPEPAPRVVAATATPAPSIIVVEPPAKLAPTIEPPVLQDEIAPAAVATMPAETLRKKEHKEQAAGGKAKRRRVATPRRRAHAVSGAVAEFAAPIADPNSSLTPPIFQTAPRSQPPQSAARPAHVRHGKIASRQARPKTKELNAASGGPSVVAPMQ